MELFVTTDRRFARTAAGAVVTDNEHSTGYRFWTRYLSAFERVTVLARVARSVAKFGTAVEGPGVKVLAIPDFHGASGLVRSYAAVHGIVKSIHSSGEPSAFLIRVPSTFGTVLVRALRRLSLPYAVEVIGDPWDVWAPGVISHPLRPVIRSLFAHELRAQVAGARAVSYVTEAALQRRYPASAAATTSSYSCIELTDDVFARPREWRRAPDPARLVFVGTLSQMYKGPDVLIDAVARLTQSGINVVATLCGGGKWQSRLEERARALAIAERVTFRGQVPSGAPVIAELDAADVFVLPSRTEGLPRAILEAMARGVPCVATRVGGIPELLDGPELVPSGDASALANSLSGLLRDPSRLTQQSRRNIDRARSFGADVLRARRVAFYQDFRVACESDAAARAA
jgi:phosphatidyl-myo-inositol dimannoside synthase